jgi:hypothetical protein
MSPKATEGVGSTGLGLLRQEEVSAPRATTPSGLPAISPSRGEIRTSPTSTIDNTTPPFHITTVNVLRAG